MADPKGSATRLDSKRGSMRAEVGESRRKLTAEKSRTNTDANTQRCNKAKRTGTVSFGSRGGNRGQQADGPYGQEEAIQESKRSRDGGSDVMARSAVEILAPALATTSTDRMPQRRSNAAAGITPRTIPRSWRSRCARLTPH